MTPEFDAYRDSYEEELDSAVAASGKPGEFFSQRKADLIVDIVAETIGTPEAASLLDVGCGPGVTDGFLAGRVGHLSGADVALELLARARTANPSVDYAETSEGGALPYVDDSFDFSFAICVMHHVDVAEHDDFLLEMRRVTQPGGIVAIFEHNPFNPATRRIVSNCVFDEGVTLLRPRALSARMERLGMEVEKTQQFLFLPLGNRIWARAERLIGWIPLGAQYVIAARA